MKGRENSAEAYYSRVSLSIALVLCQLPHITQSSSTVILDATASRFQPLYCIRPLISISMASYQIAPPSCPELYDNYYRTLVWRRQANLKPGCSNDLQSDLRQPVLPICLLSSHSEALLISNLKWLHSFSSCVGSLSMARSSLQRVRDNSDSPRRSSATNSEEA